MLAGQLKSAFLSVYLFDSYYSVQARYGTTSLQEL